MKIEILHSALNLCKLLRLIYYKPSIKGIVMSFLFLFQGWYGQAQEREYETIFSIKANRNLSNIRLYGSLDLEYSPMLRNQKVYHLIYPSLELGLSIKKKYVVGLYINDLVTLPTGFRDVTIYDPNDILSVSQLAMALTYKPKPEAAWHWLYNLKVGTWVVTELDIKDDQIFELNSAQSLLLIPNVGVEANLFPWLALQVKVGYRFSGPQDAFGMRFQRDLHSTVAQISFIMGNLR